MTNKMQKCENTETELFFPYCRDKNKNKNNG
jgi:hypothetical protein